MRNQGTRPRLIRGRTIIAVMALMAPLALAAPALAKEPTGDFAVFKQCPRHTAGVVFCLFAKTKSGEVTLGKQGVPIVNTITIQGGFTRNEETEAEEETFVGALNGETISKTPQKVPGGLSGLVRCNEISNFLERISCELIFENGATGVTAVTELAKPASAIGINTNNLVNAEGVALSLPVKVHLENPLLGGSCYIGSESHPVVLNLTTGTTSPPAPNKPISGKVGEVKFKDAFAFTEIANNTLVDNAFAAPEATGCGGLFSFLIDPILDAKIGLPAGAGHNSASLTGTLDQGQAAAVIASEK
jgi:hypothetical protein